MWLPELKEPMLEEKKTPSSPKILTPIGIPSSERKEPEAISEGVGAGAGPSFFVEESEEGETTSRIGAG